MDITFDLWQTSEVSARVSTRSTEQSWVMPPTGWIKCNADGAFYEQQWKGATGSVLRDDTGAFIRGGAKWYDHCLDALSMESMACRDGLLMARQVGAQRVWLETDSQEPVKLWRAGDNDRSSIMPILGEIRELSLVFQEFIFSFISRKCNMVAHTLAKQVSSGVVASSPGMCFVAPYL
jgi:hypothetical protein